MYNDNIYVKKNMLNILSYKPIYDKIIFNFTYSYILHI